MTLSQELTDLARRLRDKNISFDEYRRDWTSFNSIYSALYGSNSPERDRVRKVIKGYISESDAQLILDEVSESINYFSQLPPGDLRKHPTDQDFRKLTINDLSIVNDNSKSAVDRLASLATVIYQVRCNLTHGSKDPDNSRDRDLVGHSVLVLDQILSFLLK